MTDTCVVLPWHAPYWEHLQQYIRQSRVPHALLIKGSAGLGKRRLAWQYAAALLCENRQSNQLACGKCHSCKLFNAHTHPDFISIEPEAEEKALGIDLIRGLLPKLALKPQYEGFRIVIIHAAEQMNNASANAFLKCLEEPNERTVIILICANARRLPATILSRCQQLHIEKPDSGLAVAWLVQQQVANDHEALLNLAQGSPLRALDYAKEQLAPLRNACFKDWLKIARQQSYPAAVAEQWQKLPSTPLLQWLCSWITDSIKSHYTTEAKYFYNQDFHAELQVVNKKLDLKRLFALYDIVLATQKNWHTTLNKQLLFEVILINWFDINYCG